MNIIFLDIDGVLNTERFIKYQIEHHECDPYEADFNFDPICMKNLKKLIDKTNSYIVISSSWRTSKRLINEISNNLKLYDINNRFFSSTPNLIDKTRGEEIEFWLDCFSDMNLNYIIIDDENDVGKLKNRLVLCDQYYGFTKIELEKALELLRGEPNE
jgi:hypothetical protein